MHNTYLTFLISQVYEDHMKNLRKFAFHYGLKAVRYICCDKNAFFIF